MANDEVTRILAFIGECWAGKPLSKVAVGIWGAELVRYEYNAVMAVLRRMVRTHKWRPSLAEILAPLEGHSERDATAAFANVWEQINRRPRDVTALEDETVRRLGGWHTIGQWRTDEAHFHRQRFIETYNDVCDSQQRESLRELAAPPNRALPIGDDT